MPSYVIPKLIGSPADAQQVAQNLKMEKLMRFAGITETGYYEIPSKPCNFSTPEECNAHAGCQWIQSLIPEFSLCRRRLTETLVKARSELANLIEESSHIVGYAPTPEDMNRLVATTIINKAIPDTLIHSIKTQRVIGGEFLQFLSELLQAWPDWVNAPVSAPGLPIVYVPGMGPPVNMGAVSYITEKLILGTHSVSFVHRQSYIHPGDIIDLGYSEGFNAAAAFVSTPHVYSFRAIVFLGAIQSDIVQNIFTKTREYPWKVQQPKWVNIGIMAEGEIEHSVKTFITNATTPMGLDEYYELGFTRLVDVDDYVQRAQYVEIITRDPATSRNILSMYALAFCSLGLYTFQLQRSSSHHFASFLVTGRWIDPHNDQYDNVLKYGQASGFSKLFHSRTRIPLNTLQSQFALGGTSRCTMVSQPIRCLMKDKQELYDVIINLAADIASDKIQIGTMRDEQEKTRQRKDSMTDREIQFGMGATIDAVLANIDQDAANLGRKIGNSTKLLDKYKFELLATMEHYILLKSEGRFFCWHRTILDQKLRAQVAENKSPHDPVTLNGISARDFRLITGTELPPKLATMATNRFMRSQKAAGKKSQVEVRDIATNLEQSLKRKIQQVESTSQGPESKRKPPQ
jgi:hypothetical protein